MMNVSNFARVWLALAVMAAGTAAIGYGQAGQQQPNAAQLKQDAESNPSNADAQATYIQYVGEMARRNPAEQEALFKSLRANYEAWAKKSPNVPVMQWALGVVCQMMADVESAAVHFEAAVKLDGNSIPAWKGLTASAAARNDVAARRRGLQRIMELNPKDMGAAYDYITTFLHEDRAKFLELAQQFIAKNPEAPPSAALLSTIADIEPTQEKRIAAWEKLLKDYVLRPNPMQGLIIPMRGLLDSYNTVDTAKALALAEQLGKAYPRVRPWAQVADFEKKLISIQGMIKEKKGAEALEALDKFTAPFGLSQAPVEVAKANAQAAADQAEEGYAGLLKALGRRPTPYLEASARELGAKMGKTAAQVDEDFWKSLTEKNPPMRDFELTDTKGQTVKLSSLRGKAVLLHFWHPTCQACQIELPYLKMLAAQYNGKPLAVITINTNPDEEKLIGGWMGNTGFTTLLAPEKDWSKDQYNIAFKPTNFVLDAEGRILFRVDLQTLETTQLAGRAIDRLLARMK